MHIEMTKELPAAIVKQASDRLLREIREKNKCRRAYKENEI